jgi:GNAT superfamily N-acetyltransferase
MLTYRPATAGDSQLLVDLRIDFLDEVSGKQPAHVETGLRAYLKEYFDAALQDGSYVCWLAYDGQAIAGVGAMAVWTKPGNYKCPNGKVGYVMNMYTSTAYRRQGICGELLHKLKTSARQLNITMLEMHATTDGEPVYRKQQFKEPQSPFLELKL